MRFARVRTPHRLSYLSSGLAFRRPPCLGSASAGLPAGGASVVDRQPPLPISSGPCRDAGVSLTAGRRLGLSTDLSIGACVIAAGSPFHGAPSTGATYIRRYLTSAL